MTERGLFSVSTLLSILYDILDISNLENKQFSIKNIDFSVNQIFESMVASD